MLFACKLAVYNMQVHIYIRISIHDAWYNGRMSKFQTCYTPQILFVSRLSMILYGLLAMYFLLSMQSHVHTAADKGFRAETFCLSIVLCCICISFMKLSCEWKKKVNQYYIFCLIDIAYNSWEFVSQSPPKRILYYTYIRLLVILPLPSSPPTPSPKFWMLDEPLMTLS